MLLIKTIMSQIEKVTLPLTKMKLKLMPMIMMAMMMMIDDGYEKAIKKREPKRNYKKT